MLAERLACVGTTRDKPQHLVADATVVLQIGPTAGQLYQYSAGSFGYPSGNFDQPKTSTVRRRPASLTTLASGQRFVGKFCIGRLRWRFGRDAA